jgi:hypothetical protein
MATMRLALGALVLAAGCYASPTTRPAFVSAVSDGAMGTTHESKTVPVPFDRVVTVVEERASECEGASVHRRGASAGQVSSNSASYHYEIIRVGDDRLELTVRCRHRPRGVGEPAEGGYYVAADVERDESGQTRVELYSGTMGHKDMYHAVRQWLAGDPVDCPYPD